MLPVLSLAVCLCALSTVSQAKMDLVANADLVNDVRAEFLLVDFRTAEKEAAVLQAFAAVDDLIVFQVKVYVESRYLFVLYNDHSQTLKDFCIDLDLEGSATVTPVQPVYTFFKHFDDNPAYPPTNLTRPFVGEITLMERTIKVTGLTFEQMAGLQTSHATSVTKLRFKAVNHIFVQGAGLPIKFYFFTAGLDDFDVAEMMLKNTALYGGPGQVTITTSKLTQI